MTIWGRLLCALPRKLGGGHRKGVKAELNGSGDSADLRILQARGGNMRLFRCPRCGHETRYKVKPKATYEFKIAPENVVIPAEAFKNGVVLNVTTTTGTPSEGSKT